MKNLFKRNNNPGFTIVELLTIIAVISILASISIVGYGAWRQSIARNEVISDLKNVATAMEDARNWGDVYPTSLPSNFTASANVQLTYSSGNTSSYCIRGVSRKHSNIIYHVRNTNPSNPQTGSC